MIEMGNKLKIGHISYFGPNRSGLYEASRDMAKADLLGGNEVFFFDAGVPSTEGRENPKIGEIDDRADFKIVVADPNEIQNMDILVMHTGIEDNYLVKSQSPIIWVVHGKPLDCFRPEQDGKRNSYTLYNQLSLWPRTKKMLYFWPEYKKYWPVFPESKQLVFDYPVIDMDRFSIEGECFDFEEFRGKYNVLICDSDRADIDKFEMLIGAIETAKEIKGIKFHFVGLEFPMSECWKSLLKKLEEVGGLGYINKRVGDMEKFYRAVDVTFSPNRIVNRVVAESICCGTPVIQEKGGKLSDYNCYIPNAIEVVEVFKNFVSDFDANLISKEVIRKRAIKHLSMENYYKKMNQVYKEVLKL